MSGPNAQLRCQRERKKVIFSSLDLDIAIHLHQADQYGTQKMFQPTTEENVIGMNRVIRYEFSAKYIILNAIFIVQSMTTYDEFLSEHKLCALGYTDRRLIALCDKNIRKINFTQMEIDLASNSIDVKSKNARLFI